MDKEYISAPEVKVAEFEVPIALTAEPRAYTVNATVSDIGSGKYSCKLNYSVDPDWSSMASYVSLQYAEVTRKSGTIGSFSDAVFKIEMRSDYNDMKEANYSVSGNFNTSNPCRVVKTAQSSPFYFKHNPSNGELWIRFSVYFAGWFGTTGSPGVKFPALNVPSTISSVSNVTLNGNVNIYVNKPGFSDNYHRADIYLGSDTSGNDDYTFNFSSTSGSKFIDESATSWGNFTGKSTPISVELATFNGSGTRIGVDRRNSIAYFNFKTITASGGPSSADINTSISFTTPVNEYSRIFYDIGARSNSTVYSKVLASGHTNGTYSIYLDEDTFDPFFADGEEQCTVTFSFETMYGVDPAGFSLGSYTKNVVLTRELKFTDSTLNVGGTVDLDKQLYVSVTPGKPKPESFRHTLTLHTSLSSSSIYTIANKASGTSWNVSLPASTYAKYIPNTSKTKTMYVKMTAYNPKGEQQNIDSGSFTLNMPESIGAPTGLKLGTPNITQQKITIPIIAPALKYNATLSNYELTVTGGDSTHRVAGTNVEIMPNDTTTVVYNVKLVAIDSRGFKSNVAETSFTYHGVPPADENVSIKYNNKWVHPRTYIKHNDKWVRCEPSILNTAK